MPLLWYSPKAGRPEEAQPNEIGVGMWPKDAGGNWIEPFDTGWSGEQGGRDYTTENNGYTYIAYLYNRLGAPSKK